MRCEVLGDPQPLSARTAWRCRMSSRDYETERVIVACVAAAFIFAAMVVGWFLVGGAR